MNLKTKKYIGKNIMLSILPFSCSEFEVIDLLMYL